MAKRSAFRGLRNEFLKVTSTSLCFKVWSEDCFLKKCTKTPPLSAIFLCDVMKLLAASLWKLLTCRKGQTARAASWVSEARLLAEGMLSVSVSVSVSSERVKTICTQHNSPWRSKSKRHSSVSTNFPPLELAQVFPSGSALKICVSVHQNFSKIKYQKSLHEHSARTQWWQNTVPAHGGDRTRCLHTVVTERSVLNKAVASVVRSHVSRE
jgi:hypothetical protein